MKRKHRAPDKYTPTRVLLNRDQLATELNASRQIVDNLRREGAIPCIRFGHFIRFDRDAVLAALEKYHHPGAQLLFGSDCPAEPQRRG